MKDIANITKTFVGKPTLNVILVKNMTYDRTTTLHSRIINSQIK